MKGIELCADCAYYSMKKHKCTRGAKDEGEPTARFYADCPLDDVVPVAHGEWNTIEDDYCGLTALQCSECNQKYWFEDEPPIKIYNYCPNCGAKMDGDGNGQ